jgi:hypothetical protein
MRGVVLVAVAALATAAGCPGGQRARGPTIRLRLPALAAPDTALDVADMRGRIVVIHVFASWSLSAQADVESLNRVHDRSAAVVIGVGVDLDGAKTLRPWQRGSDARYPIAIASDDVRAGRTDLGAVDRVPTTLILDRDGSEARRHVGPLPVGALDRWIAELK